MDKHRGGGGGKGRTNITVGVLNIKLKGYCHRDLMGPCSI